MHFIPIDGAVVLVTIKTSPFIHQNVVDPKGIGNFGVTFTLTLVGVPVQSLHIKRIKSEITIFQVTKKIRILFLKI